MARSGTRRLAAGVICAVALLAAARAWPAAAQEARPGPAAAPPAASAPEPARAHPSSPRLPPDSSSSQTIEAGGRTLRFTATAGSLPIVNSQSRVLAEIAYTAYTLDGAERGARPVTFAFNGGPGSASTWLHLGGLGPWRMPLTAEQARPSATPTLIPNAETWLDFTDLVFIDPVGTGYSAMVGEGNAAPAGGRGGGGGNREEGGPRWFFSVNGDVDSIAEFIQTWTKRNDRLASPKMLAGESYGGFRGPRIAHQLQRRQGVGINALVLISPVIDFDGRRGGHQPLYYARLLPSIAAAALELKGEAPSRAALRGAEEYARGEYLLDLMRGPRDAAAVDRITARVASFSGLPEPVVRRYGGRLSGNAYMREVYEPAHKIASLYDVSMTGFDPQPSAPGSRFDDPFTTGLMAPLTSAMTELYTRLGWRVEREYRMLSSETNRAWVWGNAPGAPESVSALREVLALDPRVRVLVTHGFTDLVTPYLGSEQSLDQLPAFGDPARVKLMVYPGGHMHYSRDATRAALHADAERLLAEAVQRPGQ